MLEYSSQVRGIVVVGKYVCFVESFHLRVFNPWSFAVVLVCFSEKNAWQALAKTTALLRILSRNKIGGSVVLWCFIGLVFGVLSCIRS